MADTRVIPAPDAADPTFRFFHSIKYQYRYQIPVRLSGQLRTGNGRILGDLVELAAPDNVTKQGILPRSMHNEPVQERPFVFDCRLSPYAIEALLRERDASPRRDIQLVLQMMVLYLDPSFRLTSSNQAGQGQLADLVAADPTTWGPGLGEIRSEMVTASLTIYSSQWTSEFAPAFGLGDYVVVELPRFRDEAHAETQMDHRIEAARKAVTQMQADINAGHWSECIEHSRAVAELLRAPEEVRGVLVEDGASDDAANSIISSVKGAFDYASKFLKKASKSSGTLNPALVPKKEDAYYVYTTSMALINLLARKMARARESPE